jgi:hypothetical protein
VPTWDRASAARGSATHRHREARALERPALASAASEAQLSENLGLGDTATGSSPGLSLPLLNQGSGKALGVTGNAGGTAQGSLSSAIDRPSSPLNSVTNSLIGPVSNAVSQAKKLGTNPPGKQKQQNGSGGATSSSDRGPTVASKVSSAKSP